MGADSVDPPDPFALTVGDTGAAIHTHPDERSDDALDLQDSLLQAVAAAPPIPVQSPRLAAGALVGGSFRVERVLGAGAMGVVYEAHDLALDRRVALKLHARKEDDVRTSRMWREAKAMARLSHPNVIAVHEVGEHEGRVFIAMELVEGGSVRDWLREAPGGRHPWREVLRVFIQAAEGLAAAHAVELVHRDFKPDNILLGEDGRVRVADFGLARAATDEPDPAVRMPSSLVRSPSVTDRLTQTGAAVGTPAYMAPEQLGGEEVDHRGDQFSFCVALYEALYGERPYPTRSLADLVDATAEGRIRPPPSGHDVPGWVHAVVLRGLRPDPAERFPSMDALIAALRADPSRRRRRVGLGVGLAAALGLTAWVARATSTGEAPCRGITDEMTALWNPEVAAGVERALRDTGSPLAAEAIERVIPALDAHATAWARQRISACEATRVRGEQSEALLDRRMACLERRRQQLEAVVGVLAAPDPEVVEHAVQTLDALGSLEACADLAALQAQYPPPEGEAMRAAVTALHARVAALEAAAKAGRASTMVQEARAVVEEAAALDYPPLQAEAHYARHLVDHLLAEHEPAIVEAVAAHRWATMVGDARTAWRAALAVARDVGRSARGTEDALRWLETAQGWGERIELGVADRSHASRVRGEVLQHGDRVDEAIAELAGSLEQLEAESAPAGVLAGHHVGLAYLLRRAGRLDEARTHALQGIEQLEASLGQSHPEVARAYAILAQLEGARGDASSALTAIEHAVSIWRAITGESSMPHASALRERGDALTALGRFEPAIADYERALRILEALEHREPIEEVMTTVNLANTLSAQGQTTRALEFMERSLDRAIETFGADSVKVAEIRLNYGGDLAQAGRHEEGLEQSRLGLELLERHYGPSHPHAAVSRLNLALTLTALRRYDEAHAELARAKEILAERFPPSHLWHARAARAEAELLEAEGHLAQALERSRESLTLLQQTQDPLSADLIRAHHFYGRLLLQTGELAAAVQPLREALRTGQEAKLAPVELARMRVHLARALWADASARPEAHTLVDAALPTLDAEDPQLALETRQWARGKRPSGGG